MTQDLWNDLHHTVMAYLQTVTLHSLALQQKAKGLCGCRAQAREQRESG